MDFIKLAQKGYEAYSDSQAKTPGTQNTSYHPDVPLNGSQAADIADQQTSDSTPRDHFSQALAYLSTSTSIEKSPVDEKHVQDSYKVAYDEEKPASLEAQSIGAAAALKTLQSYVSGNASTPAGAPSETNFQTKMIGLAMAEAANLFDKSGATTGDKQDAINGAATTIFKLLVQSKAGEGSATTVGKEAGGLSSLLTMANSYMK